MRADGFCDRIAERTGASAETARCDAEVELARLGDDLPPDQAARIPDELLRQRTWSPDDSASPALPSFRMRADPGAGRR
ncbi:hypothetical protein GCM10009730_67760 [Streptomyces albidochromogenes]